MLIRVRTNLSVSLKKTSGGYTLYYLRLNNDVTSIIKNRKVMHLEREWLFLEVMCLKVVMGISTLIVYFLTVMWLFLVVLVTLINTICEVVGVAAHERFW